MTSPWHILDSGLGAADFNMALDEALLESVHGLGAPILRFYGWTQPAATFGYSQHYHDIEGLTLLRPLIRRPTGGGLVPHDADWTYSMAFPANSAWYQLKAVASYQRVHSWIRDAFRALGVETVLAPERRKEIPGQCFIGAEKDDVLWHGRKIAGAAQRRTRAGLLIQGSIQPPPLKLSRSDWQKAMLASISWKTLQLDSSLATAAEILRVGKYSLSEYNQKR